MYDLLEDIQQAEKQFTRPADFVPSPPPRYVAPIPVPNNAELTKLDEDLALLRHRRDLLMHTLGEESRKQEHDAAVGVYHEQVAARARQLYQFRQENLWRTMEVKLAAEEAQKKAASKEGPAKPAKVEKAERQRAKKKAGKRKAVDDLPGQSAEKKGKMDNVPPEPCPNCLSSGRTCTFVGDKDACTFCERNHLFCSLQLFTGMKAVKESGFILAGLVDFLETTLDPRVPMMPPSLAEAYVDATRRSYRETNVMDIHHLFWFMRANNHRRAIARGDIPRLGQLDSTLP